MNKKTMLIDLAIIVPAFLVGTRLFSWGGLSIVAAVVLIIYSLCPIPARAKRKGKSHAAKQAG